MDQFLPLPDHAHPFVVDDEHLHRKIVLRQGREFLHIHHEGRLTGNVDHRRPGMRHLNAERRRQAVAHGPQATRRHPAVRQVEIEILRRPHLVLANLGGDIDVTISSHLAQALDGVLRLDDAACLVEAQAVALAPHLNLGPPFVERCLVRLELALLHLGYQRLENFRRIANHGKVHSHVLVHRRRVDVAMNLGRVRRESADQTGDAVIKTRPKIQHQVAAMHRQIGFVSAVHAKHAKEMPVGCRQRAKPHQRQGGWPAGHMNKIGQQLRGARAGIDQAAAAIDHRTLGTDHHVDSSADGCRIGFGRRPVACRCSCADDVLLIWSFLHQDVFRKIDQNRARATGCSNMKCLDHGGLQLGTLFHQIVMLGTGTGDAGCVGFLKGVVANQVGRHLPGQADHRHGIHQRVGQACNRIGSAGAGCNENDTGLAGRTGITLSGMDCRLFVTNEDVLDLVVLEQSVINRKNGTARIAEYDLDTLVLERF